jgi:spermidine/putrescine-binding protein
MGSFRGLDRPTLAVQPRDNSGQIADLQKQYDALGEAAPTANMQWNRQAPKEVARTIRKEQGVASLPGVKFAETPMMDVYNPAYTNYQKNLNQYNYDKSQFDRNLALQNAQLASDWSGRRADLMNQMNMLKNSQPTQMPISGGIGGLFGRILGPALSQVQPSSGLKVPERAQTPQEIAYAKMQEQYANNPLTMKTFAPPVAPSYTPLATTMPTQYQF